MRELIGTFGFASLAIVSSLVGMQAVHRWIKWQRHPRSSAIPIAVGLAIGPFVLGLATMCAGSIFDGESSEIQVAAIFAILAVLTFFSFFGASSSFFSCLREIKFKEHSDSFDFIVLVLLWFGSLICSSILIPVIQNDALEYFTVARDLAQARSFSNYPAISTDTASGFFGPWSHPGLYVALLYLANLLQGNVEIPVLGRLIAPWFAVCASMIVFALGYLKSFMNGIISTLFFLGAPLLFLGADSALLDSLVAAGMLIATALWINTNPLESKLSAFKFGLVLGLTVWSHSQAVLFPLMFGGMFFLWHFSSRRYLSAVSGSLSMILGVMVFGIWPYLNNLRKLGVVISDNPKVFALESLDWESYFSMARGVATVAQRIQYGLFKGLFAIESYSFVFWFATILAAGVFWRVLRKGRYRELFKFESRNYIRVSFVLVAIYHIGVAFSILLGTDLMIKNERYFLVILGPVALLAATYVTQLYSSRRSAFSQKVLARLMIGYFLSQLVVVVGVYRIAPYLVSRPEQFGWQSLKPQALEIGLKGWLKASLAVWPNVRSVQYLSGLPADNASSLVLSFRPADMFYSNKKMISYLDPKMIPFYGAETKEAAAQLLREMKVKYVQVPDYYIPPIYNSIAMELLADRRFAMPKFWDQGNQIYELRESDRDIKPVIDNTKVIDFSPAKMKWSTLSTLVIGGRKSFFNIDAVKLHLPKGLFHRERSIIQYSGDGHFVRPVTSNGMLISAGLKEAVVRIEFSGDGFVKVWLTEFDEVGAPLRAPVLQSKFVYRIGELAIVGNGSFVRSIRLDQRTKYFRIGIETNGDDKIKISSATLIPSFAN